MARFALILLATLFCTVAAISAQQKDADAKPSKKDGEGKKADAIKKSFAILFTGSSFYAEGNKARYLKKARKYFAEKILPENGTFDAETANTHEDAKKLIEAKTCAFAIVTPAFYLKYGEDLKLKPFMEARPDGKIYEEWGIYAPSEYSSISDLKGKKLACVRHQESEYFKSIVLGGRFDGDLVSSSKRLDTIKLIQAKDKDAPAAILARTRFISDRDLKHEKTPLTKIWTSEKVCPMLLVTVQNRMTIAEMMLLKSTFRGLAKDKDADGFRSTLGSDEFGDVNNLRLSNASRIIALQNAKKKKN